MLARKVITRSGKRIRGCFPSLKLGRMVAWESLLERDAILLLEFSSSVVSFKEQPALVLYPDADQVRKYYPDFEVVSEDGEIFHLEVKPEAELSKSMIHQKYAVIAAHYQRQRQEFRLVTEKDIRVEPLLSNVRTLAYLNGKSSCCRVTKEQWLIELGSECAPFVQAEEVFGREAVLRLLADRVAAADLRLPLSGSTMVTIEKGGCHASYLL